LANEYAPLINEPAYLKAQTIFSRLVNSHNISVLIEHVSSFRPDVVLCFNLLGLGALQILATFEKLKLPWVWALGDTIPADLFQLPELNELLALMPFERGGSGGALNGIFVSPSKRLYQDIQERGCNLSGDLNVISNWVDFTPELQRSYFERGQTLRLCYCGYLSSAKGFDLCLRAIEIMRKRGRDNLVLNVFGDGDIDAFTKMAADLGISDLVHFHGFKSHDELFALYQGHDLLLFPALLNEPFGTVSIEAAAHGCLPLIGKQAGAAEWLDDNVDCFRVERSESAFASVLERVIAGDIELPDLARRAVERVRSQFSLGAAAEKYEDILAVCAKPCEIADCEMESARLISMLVERVAFAHVESHLNERRNNLQHLTNEVTRLDGDLQEAKRGISAYDMALVSTKKDLEAAKLEIDAVKNSKLWKFRAALQAMLSGR